MGKWQVDVFFCAQGCSNVLSLVIKLVIAILSACYQLRHGAMLKTKQRMYTFKSQENFAFICFKFLATFASRYSDSFDQQRKVFLHNLNHFMHTYGGSQGCESLISHSYQLPY